MEIRKFELTTKSIDWLGKKLFRIRALTTFGDIQAGDEGGYLEKEENLSHDGDAWIYDNAKVFDNVTISGNAQVRDNVTISGNVQVRDNVTIRDNAQVFGNAMIRDSAEVSNKAVVHGEAEVRDNAKIYDNAWVHNNTKVCGRAKVHGKAEVCDNAKVCGNTIVHDEAVIYGNAWIDDNAIIHSNADYVTIKDFECNCEDLTFFQCKDKKVRMTCEHFCGSIEEFRNHVKNSYGDTKLTKEYLMLADLMEYYFLSDASPNDTLKDMSLFND